VRTFRRRTGWKMEDVLGKDQFGFGNGKSTRDAIGMLRISEGLCACFIDWQNAFGRVNWTKIIKILMENISTGKKKKKRERETDSQTVHGSQC
jgi:hypothetical protein